MRRIVFIGYNKRSCVTGKALFDQLKSLEIENLELRRCINTPSTVPDFFIRWGNSLTNVPSTCVELNTQEAVRRSSEKLDMITTLSNAEGVVTPQVGYTLSEVRNLAINQHVYIRDRNDHIRYDLATNFTATDKYGLAPIEKSREYRVHVFNDSTLGVYQKIPRDENTLIYKNDNCDFRRIDCSSKRSKELIRGIRPMAKAAVKSLGLLFGGVDVIVSSDNTIYINEVNTAPSLNEPNIVRWSNAINNYLTSLIFNGDNELPNQQSTPTQNNSVVDVTENTTQGITDAEMLEQLNRLASSMGFNLNSVNLSRI